MNRTDRLVAMVMQLQGRRLVRAEELAQHFEVTVRTVYRDMAALEKCDYAPLLGWLRVNVHSCGGTWTSQEIVTQATGKPTDAKWHIRHLRDRYVN